MYTHHHLCHLSPRIRRRRSVSPSTLCPLTHRDERADHCVTITSTMSSSTSTVASVSTSSTVKSSDKKKHWSHLTECHLSCTYCCSVYRQCLGDECTHLRDECLSATRVSQYTRDNMQLFTRRRVNCCCKSNNTLHSIYKHTVIWSLLVSWLLLLPLMVNASSLNAFSSSSVLVNPSASTASLSSATASKSSPLTMTASGGTSSNSGPRNGSPSPRTNQYQETNPLSSLTATSSFSSSSSSSSLPPHNSHPSSTANLVINSNQFNWLTQEAISEVKKVFNTRIQKYNGKWTCVTVTAGVRKPPCVLLLPLSLSRYLCHCAHVPPRQCLYRVPLFTLQTSESSPFHLKMPVKS